MALASGQRVRRAAVKLFATRGFHGTGIRDLARAAKLSSASLYHYMGTKEDLLADIMRDCLRDLITAATETLDGVQDPRERVIRLVTLHVRTHATQPEETRIVDNEIHVLSPNAQRSVIALRDEYERLWTQAIADGLAQGVFRTTQPAVTRIALLEMCNGVARWYSPRGQLSLDELGAHFAELALRGLGACPHGCTEGRSGGE
ncbi:AcrR family transcriptional regulator [Saccharomonospora amisosensis]|uniref:AcrR family transcriptional regulator n=1 Tax=Saccharomonospora amisosensis TaxID=1128677 RepID=A0A7X5ULS0_9PSEU|nr:TetR/AcrR family transcriptional regulator [Saccharomonospora amisosensis]NIJ10371.1 AcrR family transcriptional regulator [Saccharomonospora amisosensis]